MKIKVNWSDSKFKFIVTHTPIEYENVPMTISNSIIEAVDRLDSLQHTPNQFTIPLSKTFIEHEFGRNAV